MSDAAEAINATATNTTPVSKPTEGQPPAKKGSKPAPTDFKSKVEETLWRINEPTADEVEDTKSMNEIIDKAVSNASKPTKEVAPPAPEKPQEAVKKRYVVNGKEYHLTDEQVDRFTQRGIMHELKNRDAANRAKELQQREQVALQKEQEAHAILEAIKNEGLGILVDMHGEEKARQMIEGWLRPRIEREMMPQEQRQQMEWQERAQKAEMLLKQKEQQIAQQKMEEEAEGFKEHYVNLIIGALEKSGFPKGVDNTPLVREMASWMERGLAKGIEYTPEQLVQLVNEDNHLRVSTLTHNFVNQIEAAKKAGDTQMIIQCGEKLSELLGEPVVYALGKYHLARMQRNQPNGGAVPKQIVDTAKTDSTKTDKRPPKGLTEDKVREIRQQIARGEIEPPAWW